ncbi:MAG: hypothetical protein H0T73_00650 [Ardenticatenales bacterium]|nr:hypothetical protein [Ardenticatenales bacterium]
MMTIGIRTLGNDLTLAIWKHLGGSGYYWLIDTPDGERHTNHGPFATILEAEEDAHHWWLARYLDKTPQVM